MIFNSIQFPVFVIVVFFLYYLLFREKSKWQNWLLLISSYFFYGYADVKMVPLLLLTTIIFFFLAKLVHKKSRVKRGGVFALVGVIIGIGILFYFKYFNFFVDSVNQLFIKLNITQANWKGFGIIMPLGISFFTFKLISYIIEVNRGKIEPVNDFVAFAVYISFFPTIMSGPIDRPNTFLPQLKRYHRFDYSLAVDGCRQILWGAFQKIVIADSLATYTTYVWHHIETVSGSTLVFAAILFTFQLYLDFSGYSDLAIGIGKLFGFRITKNFNYPFFATNIAEFWRRWHMSLTSWLTDYVFIPLNISFRNLGKFGMILAIIINMVLVGIWHGANWTFAVFGLYHGLLFIPLVLSGSFLKKKKVKNTKWGLPVFSDFIKMIGIFFLVTISLVIFNSQNLEQVVAFFRGIFSHSLFILPRPFNNVSLIFLFLFIIIEWKNRKHEYALQIFGLKWKRFFRFLFYSLLIIIILAFNNNVRQFVYFQF